MIDLKTIHANAKEIRNKLSLTTYPLASKWQKVKRKFLKMQ